MTFSVYETALTTTTSISTFYGAVDNCWDVSCSSLNLLQDFYTRQRLQPQLDLIEEKVTKILCYILIPTSCKSGIFWIFLKSWKLKQGHNITILLACMQYGDREVRELWPQLQRRIPSFFVDLEIEPALLHGDLWSGNAAENEEGPGRKDGCMTSIYP